MLETLYSILGVDPNATKDEIKRAYWKLAKQYHPDTLAGLGEKVKAAAEAEFKRINEARTVLMDDEARLGYDATLSTRRRRRRIRFPGGVVEETPPAVVEEYEEEYEEVEEEYEDAFADEDLEWIEEDAPEEVKALREMISRLQKTLNSFDDDIRKTAEKSEDLFQKRKYRSGAERRAAESDFESREKVIARIRNLSYELQGHLAKLQSISRDRVDAGEDYDEEAVPAVARRPLDWDMPAQSRRRPNVVREGAQHREGGRIDPQMENLWVQYKIKEDGECPFCGKDVARDQTYCYYCGAVF